MNGYYLEFRDSERGFIIKNRMGRNVASIEEAIDEVVIQHPKLIHEQYFIFPFGNKCGYFSTLEMQK